MSKGTVQLLEYTLGTTPETRVDRDKGIIYGVKVLGEKSANPPPRNHFYPRETREKVIPIFEGAAVYIDHPPRDQDPSRARSYRDRNGTLRDVKEGGDGLRANYHLNPEHPTSKQILWDAENAPENFGFSINGRGRDRVQRDGSVLIEDIPVLYSVDLVSRPATTRSCFESLDLETPPVKKKLKELAESLKAKRPGYSKGLLEMAEAGLLSPDTEMDDAGTYGPADTPPAEDVDHETALKNGFRAAVLAVLDDDSLDMKGKLGKIKDVLAAEEKLLGGGGDSETDTETDTETETDAEESHKPKVDPALRELREELAVRDLVEEAGLKFTKPSARKAFIRSLVPLDESARKELIEERRTAAADTAAAGAAGQKPKSAPAWVDPKTAAGGTKTVQESQNGDAPVFDEEARKKRVQGLRTGR